MPPFSGEREEKPTKPLAYLNFKSHDSGGPSTRASSGPFGAEPAEPASASSRKPAAAPKPSPKASAIFGDELEEGDAGPSSESDGESESAYHGASQTVFSVGWHSMMDIKKASFWKENMDSQPEKKKRKYNNSQRAATASYSRKQSEGTFKQNGTDPARLRRLVGSMKCQCFLV